MLNPLDYLLENISWYAPIYNIAWALFMLYALTLPLLFVGLFKLPGLREILPTRPWAVQRASYGYLLAAMFVIFCFRLVPYWIFDDKILHFLGGGIAIALVYEYFVINFGLEDGRGLFSLRTFRAKKSTHLLANLVLLMLFASFFSVFSELYEFVSKYVAGYEFDSSGFDTWLDILANLAGAYVGYIGLWLWKYGKPFQKNPR
jgi:ABC-type multidrug transport system fused ATPase/permease subunit